MSFRQGCVMSTKRRRSKQQAQHPEQVKTGHTALLNYVLGFAFGAVMTGGVAMLIAAGSKPDTYRPSEARPSPAVPSRRSVADLIALSDSELEEVDILEMSIAVAREIPGLADLDYDRYRQIVDNWTEQFRAWLPTVEHDFHKDPSKYQNDINFFRLGMLAQFLDQSVGVAYVEEQREAQVEARKGGREVEVAYTDPGHLLLHGLIDTKRGTCATMPVLHVAIGRRLGWPVALACASSHYVCRYDDGRRVYNIEATDTGRGGFGAGTDEDYVEQEGISRKAIAVGSDLRSLTAREMLGVFVQGRARHFQDIGKNALAARDYALAHTLFPKSRKIYIGLVGNLLPVGEELFARTENGHPLSLVAFLRTASTPGEGDESGPRTGRYAETTPSPMPSASRRSAVASVPQMKQSPVRPRAYRPPVPGAPQPRHPHQRR